MQAIRRPLSSALQKAACRQGYATASSQYAQTVKNLRINSDTKVIYQGFTGKQGSWVVSFQALGVAMKLIHAQVPRPAGN